MDHMSIITQVSNPKEEEIISFNQEKGKKVDDAIELMVARWAIYFSQLMLARSSRLLAALVVDDTGWLWSSYYLRTQLASGKKILTNNGFMWGVLSSWWTNVI